MPRIIHKYLRFQVIDSCLRDVHREYKMLDILEKCNKLMMKHYGTTICLRSMQYDISILKKPPFCIELDESLLKRGIYRYEDVNCPQRIFLQLDELE